MSWCLVRSTTSERTLCGKTAGLGVALTMGTAFIASRYDHEFHAKCVEKFHEIRDERDKVYEPRSARLPE